MAHSVSMEVKLARFKQFLLWTKIPHVAVRAYLFALSPLLQLRRARYRKPADWHARTYLQKLQWRCKNPDPDVDYAQLVDKHRLKAFAGSSLSVPRTYDIVARPGDIDIGKLPSTYVMKATHGWNMGLLVIDGIIQGKNATAAYKGKPANWENLHAIATQWLNSLEFLRLKAREYHYRDVKPGLMFEELIPFDYELEMFLFNGICRITTVQMRQLDFRGDANKGYRLYDHDWRLLDPGASAFAGTYDHSSTHVPPPATDFLQRLEHLCKGFDHVRADFLVSRGEPYLNELTFTHNAGRTGLLGPFEATLGKYWL